MGRIQACFEKLKQDNKKALIPYVAAGDPNPEVTVPLMHSMVAAGADIIELGVPFSDPMADGPTIQKATERALIHGTSLDDVFEMVQQFRQDDSDTPVVLMGYLNPIEVMGYETFAKRASQAGVDGVLTVDLPPEEASVISQQLRDNGLDRIFLIAPTTTVDRIASICEASSGYVYYVSLKGVTGASNLNLPEVQSKVEQIHNASSLPVCVGFGIKDAETAQQVSTIADGVVVGSALVKQIEALAEQPNRIPEDVPILLKNMRESMDAV